MSDQAASVALETVDGAPCPFCGKDPFADSSYQSCEHLVASWIVGADDNGAGVFGGTDSGPGDALDALDLAHSCQDLQRAVIGDGDSDGWDARYQRLESAFPVNDRPAWWAALCDAIFGLADEAMGDEPRELGRLVTPFMDDLLASLPGLRFMYTTINNMMNSTSNVLIWAEDREAANTEIDSRIADATQIVRLAIPALKG